MESWVASIRTPQRPTSSGMVNPSPHPMQQLESNPGNPNPWSKMLFANIREEGVDLTVGGIGNQNGRDGSGENEMLKISAEEIQPEIDYWKSAIVCYILGVKPPFRIVDGFIRRVWGKYGIDRVSMMNNGVFVVRFRNNEDKVKAMEAGPILYDRKPFIMKQWSPELDLIAEDVKVVPTWVRFPSLPLKYWGQQTLTKLASRIGKPIRTDRATAQKEILEYARVLVEVKVDQEFPKEILFMNEQAKMTAQQVIYECKPIFCDDCKGIGHNKEECRQKRFEVATKKIKTKQIWVRRQSQDVERGGSLVQQPNVVQVENQQEEPKGQQRKEPREGHNKKHLSELGTIEEEVNDQEVMEREQDKAAPETSTAAIPEKGKGPMQVEGDQLPPNG
ncbi:uncharacterized protein LOC125495654 [Beta vulgaris subsp. vulgaris]|uniref:uncharacterized protein LOC125495654 n=1 Tax=Beta vulgaris subsp. vulgaris TaxID=3555 RepID=UPI00203743EA|nr:uncharacterized protein LOC125495654 [Beta vulgaris subsp. vulgaris]